MKDGLYSIGYSVSSRLVLFLINYFAVTNLSNIDYGQFSILNSIVIGFSALSTFGAGVTINKCVSKYISTNADYVGVIYRTSFIFTLIISCLLGVTYVLYKSYANVNVIDIESTSFVCFSLVLISVSTINEGVIYGLRKNKELLYSGLTAAVIISPLSYFFIKESGLVGVMLSLLGYRTLLYILNSAVVRFDNRIFLSFHITRKDWKVAMSEVLNTSIPSLLGTLFVAPVFPLVLYMIRNNSGGLESVSILAWAYNIYMLSIFIPSALNGFLISRFSSGIFSVKKIFVFNFIFAVLVVSVLYSLSGFIFSLTPMIDDGKLAPIFYGFLCVIFLYCINASFSSIWVSCGKAWLGCILNFIWTVIVLLISMLTCRIFGALSFVFGLIGAYLVLFLLQFYLHCRVIN